MPVLSFLSRYAGRFFVVPPLMRHRIGNHPGMVYTNYEGGEAAYHYTWNNPSNMPNFDKQVIVVEYIHF